MSSENLHSVVLNIDVEMTGEALMYTFISQSQRKGMSVLREAANDDEFRTIINQRLNNPKRLLKGFVTFSCGDVRCLQAAETAHDFNKGDRLYYVVDTDMEGVPHHADIFATVSATGTTNKAMRRQQRNRMMELLAGKAQSHEIFRDGAFSEFAAEQQVAQGQGGL